ncbi:hypothetical protein [Clostridium arbusti]|uniref:hypothetical protein n=1 Tax=Clostridium arbusti TaxID=1137848 RepID=UPI000289D09E|nr:hypothetical protein [Clostridium arbusti]
MNQNKIPIKELTEVPEKERDEFLHSKAEEFFNKNGGDVVDFLNDRIYRVYKDKSIKIEVRYIKEF